MQEDCKVKCFRYFPQDDDQEDSKLNYVQFEQVFAQLDSESLLAFSPFIHPSLSLPPPPHFLHSSLHPSLSLYHP